MFSDYSGETEPDPTEFLALSQQSQHPYLWAEHLMGKAEGIPPPVKHTYSKDHPWAGMNAHSDTAMPGAFQTAATYSLCRVKELACWSVLLAYTTQTEAPLLLLFAMGGVGDMQKIPKGKRCMAASGEVLFESSERQPGKTDFHQIYQSQLET